MLQSEDFSTTWAVTRATITTNTTTAPNGAATADKLVEDSTASNTHSVVQAPSFVSGTTYTYSVYAKAAERTRLRLQAANQTTWPADVLFDLSNGTIVSTTAGIASIQNIGNGWYRCSVTATSGQSFTTGIAHYLVSGTVIAYTGDGTSGIYLWGAQLEAGAFPTSYIATTTAAATRAADVASITGSAFSSWYRQDEGTFYGETANVTGGAGTITVRASADSANRMQISNGAAQTAVIVGGVLQAIFGSSNVNKVAFGFKANDFAQSRGIAGLDIDTSGTLPIVNMATIGSYDFGGQERINSTISRLTYWPQALPSRLQSLTL
jgi:hypothetical protein